MIFKIVFFTLLFLFHLSGVMPALAVQQHGGAEGLVSHQVGHLLFILGMGYLLYRVSFPKVEGPGWPEFKNFLVLILLWNGLTFAGHWMSEFVPPHKFVRVDGQVAFYAIDGLWDLFFYLTRLDHLVLVPSFLFLLVAIKKWSRQP